MTTIELTKEQRRSISNYGRMGIDIEVLDDDTLRIKQSRLLNGYILNQQQLVQRAREVFDRGSWKVIPMVYSLDVDIVTIEWIEAKMNEFGIKRNDIIKQLAIDKSTLSSIFAADRGLTKSQRAAFFFYFLTYELNRDFRQQSNSSRPEVKESLVLGFNTPDEKKLDKINAENIAAKVKEHQIK